MQCNILTDFCSSEVQDFGIFELSTIGIHGIIYVVFNDCSSFFSLFFHLGGENRITIRQNERSAKKFCFHRI